MKLTVNKFLVSSNPIFSKLELGTTIISTGLGQSQVNLIYALEFCVKNQGKYAGEILLRVANKEDVLV